MSKKETAPVSILLVDDQERNLKSLSALLDGMGLNIVEARSGNEALKRVLDEDFAVILMDVQMPDMDGFETASLIRKREKSREIPIIFLTAIDTNPESVFRGYTVGAIDYLFKPPVPAILRSKITIFVELYKKTDEIRRQAERLRQSNAALEAFTYSVSHDLQAPLRSMRNLSSLLLAKKKETQFDPKSADIIRRIIDASNRMENMVQDLLSYSRLDSADLPSEALPLNQVAAAAMAQLEAPMRERKAEVAVERGLPWVRGNRTFLVQVVTNLVSNAVKFVPPGRTPSVRIRAEAGGDAVRLWVEDNGIGIEAADKEKIFQLFTRLQSMDLYPGSGIGLAIVAKAVDRMEGRLGVESVPGEGSRFWVELPKAQAPETPALPAS